MSAQETIQQFARYLSDYEKKEVLEYGIVHYLNISQERVHPIGTEANNFGYDNDKQEYLCQTKDHIQYRYEIKKQIGKGSFGHVYLCHDHKHDIDVALKILKNQKRLHKQGLIEAGILQSLKERDPDDKRNIVRIIDSFVFRKHLIMTFEVLQMNLYDFLKRNNFAGVSESLVRRFAI